MAHIKKLSPKWIDGFPINSLYVRGERGSVLVDTGVSGKAGELLDLLIREGIELKEIKAIFITHVHLDHAGGISKIVKSMDGVSVAVHKEGAELLQKGSSSSMRPAGFIGWTVRPFAWMMGPLVRTGSKFPPCNPDVVIEDETDLDRWGVEGGKIIFTPGHTPESISLIVPEDGSWSAIVGDLFIGSFLHPGKPREHFILHDRHKARESIRRLLQWEPQIQTFYTGHFGPFSRPSLLQEFKHFL